VEHGADINEVNIREGETPLFNACFF